MMAKRPARDPDRGSVAIILAVCLVAFMGIGALVLDFGRLFHAHAQLQNGVDAAALAGAMSLDGTSAGITKAQTQMTAYANANTFQYGSSGPGGVVVNSSHWEFG